jgi:hypothetical protein
LQLLTNNKSQQKICQSDQTKITAITQPQEIASNESQKQKKAVQPVTPWNVAQRKSKSRSISPTKKTPTNNINIKTIETNNTFAGLADPPNQQ